MKRFGLGALTLWLCLGSIASASIVPGGRLAAGINVDSFFVTCRTGEYRDTCWDTIAANAFARAEIAKPAASYTDARYGAAFNDGPPVSSDSDKLSADLDTMSFVHSSNKPEDTRVNTPPSLPTVVPEPGSFTLTFVCLTVLALGFRRQWSAV